MAEHDEGIIEGHDLTSTGKIATLINQLPYLCSQGASDIAIVLRSLVAENERLKELWIEAQVSCGKLAARAEKAEAALANNHQNLKNDMKEIARLREALTQIANGYIGDQTAERNFLGLLNIARAALSNSGGGK